MQGPPPNLNLPPDVAAALQEQVSKMTPAQMQAMMDSMKGVDMAAAAAQAQAALSGLSADQVRAMGSAMASTPPETVRANVSAVNARLAAEVAGAAKLKADGNAAFSRGDHGGAADAWARAAKNLEAHTSTEAVALRRACQLNLALAHLKTEAWAAAEAAATAVLQAEPSNAKALLRRGCARVGLKKGTAAVKDLEAALAAAAPDDKAVVRDKLEEARALLVDGGDGVVEEEVEEVEEVAAATPAPLQPPPPQPFPGMGAAMPTGAAAAAQAAQMRAFAAALRANPSLKDTVAAQAAAMTPDQVAAAARAAGAAPPPPEALTPQGMAMAAQAAAGMTPETLEAMADALEKASGGGGSAGGAGATTTTTTTAAPPLGPPPPADMASLMKDPAMIKQAASMMKAMDPKTVAAMSGGAVSEAQAAAMQEKLGALSEAQLEKLVTAAQTVQAVRVKVDAAKAWLAARPGVVAAVAVLFMAVMLRRWGWV